MRHTKMGTHGWVGKGVFLGGELVANLPYGNAYKFAFGQVLFTWYAGSGDNHEHYERTGCGTKTWKELKFQINRSINGSWDRADRIG